MGRWRDGLRSLLFRGATPGGIAGGFALGLSLSLVPIPAAGMLVALALAPVLRLNIPATYGGSAVVNPLTGPFIYFAELWLGLWLTGQATPSWSALSVLDAGGWWDLLVALLGPFLLGAAVMAVVAGGLGYCVVWLAARSLARRRRTTKKGDRTERSP